ncbi:MAG: hypothetical protein O7F08_12880, partial [Deltaproteobacteria bacterium]|nr:hypothetical protein [Deltaproteobacteria bacterium]
MRAWVLVAALGLWAAPASVSAHQKSVSYSKWTLLDGGAVAQVKVSWFDLTSLPVVQDAVDTPFEPAT